VRFYKWNEKCLIQTCNSSPESNLLELARGLVPELFPNSFSISFSRAADWQNATLIRKSQNLCQSAAWEKEIEDEFGNNSRTSPLASSKRLDSGQMSSGQMSFWANVSGQMSLGKCCMGKCRVTLKYRHLRFQCLSKMTLIYIMSMARHNFDECI
jgi:hypothetical protein